MRFVKRYNRDGTRPRLIMVIESEKIIGSGTDNNPIRAILEYHTVDGEFLAREPDPFQYRAKADHA